MSRKNVLVVGAGGVGVIAALTLHLSGLAHVSMVVRSDYDRVIDDGYTIESVDHGDLLGWKPDRIVKSVSEAVMHMGSKLFDFVVVCTKVLPELYKTEELIEDAVTPGVTTVVLLQNGIGIEESVANEFRDNVVLSGTSMIGSINYGGKIVQFEHDIVSFGYYESGYQEVAEMRKKLAEFGQLYSARCYKCTLVDDLAFARWKKLVYNSTINTVCALTELDSGRAYLSGIDETIIMPAMQEIKAIAKAAMGVDLPDGVDKDMLTSDDGVYYKPSMQVDREKGNPLELEAILGNPLRIAKDLGVPAPILTVVYNLLKGVQFKLLEQRGYLKVPKEYKRDTTEPIW